MNREMMKALEADGEKLRQLTGEDHGPHFICDIPAPCPECWGDCGFEEAGSGKWSRCTFCDGKGEVESEAAVGLRDLDERCGVDGEEARVGCRNVEHGHCCGNPRSCSGPR